MYGKIFSSMYDGSLYGQWEAIVTFQQMIVLSDAEGFVDMTPQALAARTSIPLEIINKGIELLSAPDKYSRSPDCDGRRIELVDVKRPWGWRIVNYPIYRRMASADEKRESDRLRIAEKRRAERGERGTFHEEQTDEKSQGVAGSREASCEVANVAYAEAEAEAKKNTLAAKPLASGLHAEIIADYHDLCPMLPRVKSWPKRRARKLNARIDERCAQGKPAETRGYWQQLFRKVAASDFLCGRIGEWRADLEWLLDSAHFDRVIEGRYDNNGNGHGRG